MDLFCEQLVKYKKNVMDKIQNISMVLATLILGVLVFTLLLRFTGMIVISFALAGLVIYLGFCLVSNTSKEFEYIITNADIDIDKIIAGRKRKRVISTNMRNFTGFGKYKDSTPKFSGTVINVSDNCIDSVYYAEVKDNKRGNVRILFSPNEKLITHIKPYVTKFHPEFPQK